MRFILLLAAVSTAFGQSQFATLTGTIHDSTGAVVPAVEVKLVNVETGEVFPAASTDQGSYTIPLVKPGQYRLDAEKPGFKPYRQTGIVLETGGQPRIDIALEVGSQSERVTVEAAAPQLQTETSAVGATVDNRTIINMPLINRRAAQLARLTGFVVQNGTGSNFTMAGGRGNNTNWRVDGANVQNVLLGDQGLTFDPPNESLQEFNVAVSNYSAELGRTGGGVVQMTTKSGTNEFHGSAYEYLRNDAFDARTFFAANQTPLRYNLFGASLGGPIRKDRTHFFANYEGRRTISGSTFIHGVPTAAERQGDFSGSRAIVRDPENNRTPFPGNIIPVNRQDPMGRAIAAFYPDPNVAGQGSGNANFRANGRNSDPPNTYTGRADHMIGDRDRMYARVLASHSSQTDDPVWGTDPAMDPIHRRRQNYYVNLAGTWFHNFAPTVINEFRGNFDRRKFINQNSGAYSNFNKRSG